MISVHFQGKPFNITVIQVYAPTSNAEEAEVERFSEDLQDLLELTLKKDVLFIIGDWNAKVGSQEIPGVKQASLALEYRMKSVRFQVKPFIITVIQVYAPTSNVEEAELNGSMKTYKTF